MLVAKDFSRTIDFSKALRDEWASRYDGGSHLAALIREDVVFRSEPPNGPGNELFTFSSASDGEVETASFDGGAGNDTLDATFGAVGFATGGLTTSFTDNGDGTFSATYSRGNAATDGDDSVSIVNVENVFISIIGDSNGVGNEDFVQTGDGDDNIFTDNGADTIVAGKGVDTVDGGSSDEFGERDVISKDFSDVFVSIDWNMQTGILSGPGSFVNVEAIGTLLTGSAADTIVTGTFTNGNAANQIIATGGGRNSVSIFGGIDNIDLGAGTGDRLIVDWSNIFISDAVMTLNEDLPGSYSGHIDPLGSAHEVFFAGVEHFTILMPLSGGNGSNLADTIVTGDGNDIVSSGASNDKIYVGFGIDRVDGGEVGSDIDGLSKQFGAGSVGVHFDLDANTYSGPGDYTNLEYFIDLKTGNADDIVVTSDASDGSGRGDDVIQTRGGDDMVTLFNGHDTVDLGDGNDRLVIDFATYNRFNNGSTMSLTETSPGTYSGTMTTGTSGISMTFAGVENFTIHMAASGGNGSNLVDTIVTGDGNDDIFGGASSDNIYVGGGQDTVDGGEVGSDVDGLSKEFGVNAPKIVFDLFTGGFSGPGSYTNLEYFIELKTGAGNDVIDTSAISSSGRGDDVIDTRGGNDKVTMRHGNDTVNMGAGNDTLIIDYATTNTFTADTVLTITETSPGTYSGQWSTVASSNGLTFSGVESFIIKTAVSGGNGSNLTDDITTGDGNDVIYTYASSDTVHAGGGRDYVDGGVSNDTLDGGEGNDKLYGDAGNDSLLGGNGNDRVHGGDNNDRLEGGEGNDKMFGDAGNDTLLGEAGNDKLVGNDGADSLVGGEGDDKLFAGNDNDTLDGGDGADTLSGAGGDDTISGGIGNDILRGDNGKDVIDGGAGDDAIFAGKGADTLTGGEGADIFRFQHDSQFDTITDFEHGVDQIHLRSYREENGGRMSLNDLLITQNGDDTRIELDLNRDGIADVIDLDGDGTGDGWHVDLLDTDATTITAVDFVF